MRSPIRFYDLIQNHIVDVLIGPNFGNFTISVREVFVTSNLKEFGQKSHFFEEFFWFKFSNLGLALGLALKFYTSVLKLK